MKGFISPEIRSYTSEEILEMIGPAETQYVLTLGFEGAQGPLACGSTIVDNDTNDMSPFLGIIGFRLVWNDLPVETGYRWQWDLSSASFITEDVGVEPPANVTAYGPIGVTPPSGIHTFRVFAHVGHAPGHGGTPIAGDVVSNDCAITLTFGDFVD